jgi:hypothetical protein
MGAALRGAEPGGPGRLWAQALTALRVKILVSSINFRQKSWFLRLIF